MTNKQLDIFSKISNTSSTNKSSNQPDQPDQINKWQIFVDGAARNNPGPAGAGIYILKDSKPIFSKGYFLNNKTNNQAEYLALLLGLLYLSKQIAPQHVLTSTDHLEIISDSQLLVRQLTGKYRIRNPELKKIYNLVIKKLSNINYSVTHVLRHLNKQADRLANLAIDKKILIPAEFLAILKQYEISI